MIQKISSAIARLWVKEGIIPDNAENLEVYCYGLELLFSTTINLLLVVVISILFRKPFLFVPYLLGFIPIRVMAGGYHARNHWSCICLYSTSYAAILFVMLRIGQFGGHTFCIVTAITSFLIVYILSPVPAENKPLSPKEAKLYRKTSLVFAMVDLLGAIILLRRISEIPLWIKMFFSGESMAAISLVAAKMACWLANKTNSQTTT